MKSPANVPLSDEDRANLARQQAALHATGQLRKQLDLVYAQLADLIADLHTRSRLAASAVGTDSTRPGYTEDLKRLHREQDRLARLTDLVGRRG